MKLEKRFINRERKLETLQRLYRSQDPQLVIIYGRRRVGKTAIIKEFLRGKQAIYFLADLQEEKLQINRFKEIVSEVLEDELLKSLPLESWDTLFRYLLDRWPRGERLLIVIDEFQYLAKVNSAIPSIFQRLWDELLSKTKAYLILCGSMVSMMYETTLSYTSPLYGRRTAQLKVIPLKFKDYLKLFSLESPEEVELAFSYYSITGGIPLYLYQLKASGDIWRDLEENLLNPYSFLYAEPLFLLKEEIREPTTYLSALQVVAGGERKLSSIASRLGIKASSLTPFIEKLIDIGFLKKEVPVTKNPTKTKAALYSIGDNFISFWLKYVLPNRSAIELEDTEKVVNRIKEDFKRYLSLRYEELALDSLRELLINRGIEAAKIGRWWDKSYEIDLVSLRE